MGGPASTAGLERLVPGCDPPDRRSVVLLLGALMFFSPPATEAQAGPGSVVSADTGRRDASPGATALGALLGGAAGLVGGALVGGSGDCYEFCLDIAIGAAIGEVLGVALGAHAFNRGRGNPLADVGTSAGVGALGILVASGIGRAEDGVLLVAGLAQIAAVTLTEVRTSPRIEPAVGVRASSDGLVTEIGFRIR